MHFGIDRTRCEGSGICVGVHPDAFEFGDDMIAVVVDEGFGAELTAAQVEGVVSLCPFGAIQRVDPPT